MKKKLFLALLFIGITAITAICISVFAGCNITEGGAGNGGNTGGNGGGSAPVAAESVTVTPTTVELTEGETAQLYATVLPATAADKSVTWEVDEEEFATVSRSGLVTAVAEGTATVTVKTANGKTATCTVTVKAKPTTPVTPEHTSHSYKYTDLDETNHKKTCTGCTEIDVTEAHVYDNAQDTTCNLCNHIRTVEPVTPEHTSHSYKYTDLNETSHKKTCTGCEEVNVTEEHVYDDAQDTECNLCNHIRTVEPVTPPHISHIYKYTDLDETSHKKTCTGCTEIDVTEEHVYDDAQDTTCNLCNHTRKVETETPVTPVTKYTVTFISDGETLNDLTEQVEAGKKVEEPAGMTKDGYAFLHWAVGSLTGAVYDFNEPVDKNLDLYAVWEKNQTPVTPPDDNSPITYSYAGNECAAFEWTESNAASAKVEYKKSSESTYATVDKQLIRDIGSGKARVDIVGLAGGVKYDFKITTSAGTSYTKSGIEIAKYDRSGYAHFNYTQGVGAYKDDGTLKSGAVVVYVTEATKNTVTAKIGSKTYTGIVSILQNAGTSTPLVVRVIGTVGAATWTQLDYNADNKYSPSNVMPPENVKGVNGVALAKQNWTQKELIDGGYNTLNTSVYSELIGLNSKIKWDGSKNEFDSCWNDCNIQDVKNVTVEGIGEDARIFQWGFTFKNSSSIEVRNLTFEDYTEDACSFEGGDTSASSLSGFSHGNIWVHHNTFEEGVNYWDVCKEQDKHDGDGSTDFKGLKNITLSYNVYNKTHKTGLIGGSNTQTTANVTFHHNAYNNCKARLPLARQANMHMYNNYYNGTTSCDLSLRANAYALVENCYFESKNNCPVELQHDSTNGDGSAKLVGCTVTEKNIVLKSGVSSGNLYVGNDRSATVTQTNKYCKSDKPFDTDSDLFYYDAVNKKSDVTEMLTAAQVKTEIPRVAGVQKRGDGTVGGEAGGETGDTPTTDKVTYTYSVANKEVVTSSNATGTITVTGWKTDTAALTGNQISHNDTDFKFDGNAYTVKITVNAKAGQKIAVKLTGFTGSSGNAVGANVEATNATLTSASKVINFTATSSNTAKESGTVEYTAKENGSVEITITRSVTKTTRVTNIEVTVG